MRVETSVASANSVNASEQAGVSADGAQVAALDVANASAANAQARPAVAISPNAQRVTPGPDGVVRLPEGVSLEQIAVSGPDLVVQLPDGGQLVIVNGAVNVPQLVIGDVEIPAVNVAALLAGNEPEPAAGGPQSSGGNFAVAVGDIGPGIGIGNLLPPTGLEFTPPEFEEVYHVIDEDEPTVIIITPDLPAGAPDVTQSTSDAGLPGGSAEGSGADQTTGTISFTPGDLPAVVTIDGIEVEVGVKIFSEHGYLEITSVAPGEIGYVFVQTQNVLHPPESNDVHEETFVIVVTDADGDTATGNLTITIMDDAPTANADADSVGEHGPTVANGNVMTGTGGNDANNTDGVADFQGADDAVQVTGVVAGSASSASGNVGTTVNGTYGTLVIGANGAYTYTLNPNHSAVNALDTGETLTDTFTYTITDADSDTSTTTLTITINGANDAPVANADTHWVLDVTTGADPTATGNVLQTINHPGAPAGSFGDVADTDVDVEDLTVTTTGIFNGTYGTLQLNANGSYTYTLNANHAAVNALDDGETLTEVFNYTATDGTASVGSTLTITIFGTNDAPTVGSSTAVVSEEGLEDANADSVGSPDTTNVTTINGTVAVADTDGEALTVTLGDPGAVLTSGGAAVTWSGVGTGTLVGSAGENEVIRIVIEADGDYTVTLSGPVDHADDSVEDDLSFDIPVSVSDGTATTTGGTLTVRIEDDSPTAQNDGQLASVDDNASGVTIGTVAGLLSNDSYGADGEGSPAITIATGSLGGTVTISGGNLVYTSAHNVTSPFTPVSETFTYTIEDADGDTATATFTVQLTDEGPSIDEVAASVAVDEEGLGGNAGAVVSGDLAGEATTQSGTLSGLDFGGDGAGDIALTAVADTGLVTLAGNAVSTTWDGTTHILTGEDSVTGEDVFTLEITDVATGAYTFTLLQPVKHATADVEDDASFNVEVVVTDAEGDSATGSISITIDDDSPLVTVRAGADAEVLLTTQDAETIGAAFDTATADFSGVFSATPSYGADGAGSTVVTYSMTLLAGAGADSGLTSDGATIYLHDIDGVITGSTEADAGDVAAANTVFTLSVDSDTGVVTSTQYAEVDHALPGDASDYDAQLATLGNELVGVTATAVTTDGDGDTATDSETADLGGNVRFADDGPSVTVTTDGEAEVLLTTQDAQTIGAAFDTATADFSGVFTATPSYDADGAGTTVVTYALGLAVAGGTDSGLASDGATIYLHDIGGVITGSTEADIGDVAEANTVFTLEVDSATGVVTSTQYAEIDHDAPGSSSNYDAQLTSLANGLVQLTATAVTTDGDGDTATDSETIDLGGNVQFADDGPSVAADGTVPTLVVDETNLAVDATADFSDVFVSTFGADGAGSVSYALSLSGNPSGLVDVATGLDIVLGMNGDVVEGWVDGDSSVVAFTVSVDGSGNVTLDQLRALQHADGSNPNDAASVAGDAISLTATATDGDGDTATASADIGPNLTFLDDGPSISAEGTVPTLTVDETNLAVDATADFSDVFSSAFGADGAGAVSYALAISGNPSGLVDVATGLDIVLGMNGDVVEGWVGGDSSVVAFTVSVDGSGNVTLDQLRALQHADGSNPNDAVSVAGDAISLSATVTDRDGDTATASADIGGNLTFHDDGPSISADGTVPTLVVDETDLTTDATADFSDVFSSAFGADGAGSVSYALSVSGDPSGLVDVATGLDIVLGMNGSVVEGWVGGDSSIVAFTVSVDGSGNVTLDQLRALQHADGSNPNDAVSIAGSAVSLTATVTDADGDQASASADIGGSLTFHDDGPSIDAAGTVPTLAVDETDLSTDATADFSDVFVSAFGADGAGTVTYALSLSGNPSGLVDVATGLDIVLGMNGSVVEGWVDGDSSVVAFTVSVDGSGNVTLDQLRALQHADGSNPNDAVSVAGSAVSLTATVTDADGDQASASADIGGSLTFYDDGPSIDADGTVPTLVVDETDLSTDATADFSDVFSSAFGADGAGSVSYALGVVAGASGLVDTATGENVILSMNGNVVEGRTEGSDDLVFTVSVDGSGNVTLDQVRAVVHGDTGDHDEPTTLSAANLITLTATVTDGDGDTDTASADIGQSLSFEDDGPSITSEGTVPTLTVDETVLATNASADFSGIFTPDFGADGEGSVSYALGVVAGASGLVDTATGENVILSMNGNVVEGRTEGSDDLVFTVSVDGSGNVTLDQVRAVVHGDTGDHDEPTTLSAANLITLTATITDGDGDTDTASADIGQSLSFEDDGPSITSEGTVPTLTVDETVLATNASADFSGIFAPDFGADGEGSVSYALGVVAGASGLVDTATGENVILSMNGNVVEGRTEGSDDLVFTVSVDGSGNVTLDQVRAVVHGDTGDHDEPTTLSAANLITLTATVTDGDGDTDTATADIGQSLSFEDDGPSAVDDGQLASVDDNAVNVNIGTVAGLLADDSFGADGEGSPNITIAQGDLGGTVTISGGNLLYTSATNITSPFTPATETFTYTIADGDGDTTTATFTVEITDEGPSITPASASVSVDEEGLGGNAGQQAPITGDLAGQATTQSGTLAGLDFGIDGAGDITLTAVADTGLFTLAGNPVSTTWDGTNHILTGEDSVTGEDVFTLEITDVATVAYTFTLLQPVEHATAGAEDDASFNVEVVVTDAEGDSATGSISVTIDDDSPVVTAAENIEDMAGTTGTADFAFSVGADKVSTADLTSYLTVGITGSVGAVAITNVIVTADAVASTSTSAVYDISFDYAPDPDAPGEVTNATGTLTFNGSTYTLTLDAPIESHSSSETADTISSTGYNLSGSAQQSEIVVSELDNNIWIQFMGDQETGGGNAVLFSSGGNTNFVEGELVTASQTYVTISGDSNGVAGDTIQSGEVLDMDFFEITGSETPPAGVAQTGDARIGEMFMEFDLYNSQDLVVILKLVNPDDPSDTATRAIIVNADDVYTNGDTLPASYSEIVLDNNDGLLVIEQGDYNLEPGDNYVIYGAQVLSSTQALTGSGYEFDGNVGSYADGTTTAFSAATVDTDVLKITNIGFQTVTTTTETLHLDIEVTVTDEDGDSSATTHLLVNPVAPPVALDLDGDGVEFVGQSAGVTFDYFGDGSAESTAWVSNDDGILAIDKNGNGIVDDGSEIVFAVGGSTDLEGLRQTYDTNGDGKLSAADADFAKFGVLQNGEFTSLTDAGIVSLDLVSDGQGYTAANGEVTVAGEATFTRADGSTGTLADAAFAYSGGGTTEEAQRSFSQTTGGYANLLAAAAMITAAATELAAAETPTFDVAQPQDSLDQAAAQIETVAADVAEDAPVQDDAFDGGVKEGALVHDTVHFSQDLSTLLEDAGFEAQADEAMSSLLGGTELATPQYAEAAPMLVDATVMPIVTPPAPVAEAAAQAEPELVAEVLADALSGGAEAGVSIDDLLAALPSAGDGALLGGIDQVLGEGSMVLASHPMTFNYEVTLVAHHDSVAVA